MPVSGLAESETSEQVLSDAVAEFGRVDTLGCNQALSGSDGAIGELTAVELNRHWAVDARVSPAAIAGVTVTIADQLTDTGTRVNTVNPGPVSRSSDL